MWHCWKAIEPYDWANKRTQCARWTISKIASSPDTSLQTRIGRFLQISPVPLFRSFFFYLRCCPIVFFSNLASYSTKCEMPPWNHADGDEERVETRISAKHDLVLWHCHAYGDCKRSRYHECCLCLPCYKAPFQSRCDLSELFRSRITFWSIFRGLICV